MTGDAQAEEGSARPSGDMSDKGDPTACTRRAEVGAEMGEEPVGRTLPLAFFSLARLF